MAVHDSNFVKQIRSLKDRVFGRSHIKDSLLDRAITYYTGSEYTALRKEKLDVKLAKEKEKLAGSKKKDVESIEQAVRQIESQLQDLEVEKSEARQDRLENLNALCDEILSVSEGINYSDTNRKSAQCLGTIQLVSPTEGGKVASENEISKPIYRAILSLRVLDEICIEQIIKDPYIQGFLAGVSGEKYQLFAQESPEKYQLFTEFVKVPIIMAALLQDIGNYHPEAQELLYGEDGEQDPFRILPVDERKKLLQINYRETVRYFVDGLGARKYIGRSKEERDVFDNREREKLTFIKHLLRSSVNPKQGVGNVLKVPQIYCSIIFSTKSSYSYKVLPKVYQVLNQNAERGACSQTVVDALYKITGMFPQGYGITYRPSESDGSPSDTYEYAIVTRLYPSNPEQPICRVATRKLAFIGYGHDITIPSDRNLYFPETAKSMVNISKERLAEILELLSSNYQERKDLDLIPRCWHSKEYFSMKGNQNLWNKQSQ